MSDSRPTQLYPTTAHGQNCPEYFSVYFFYFPHCLYHNSTIQKYSKLMIGYLMHLNKHVPPCIIHVFEPIEFLKEAEQMLMDFNTWCVYVLFVQTYNSDVKLKDEMLGTGSKRMGEYSAPCSVSQQTNNVYNNATYLMCYINCYTLIAFVVCLNIVNKPSDGNSTWYWWSGGPPLLSRLHRTIIVIISIYCLTWDW